MLVAALAVPTVAATSRPAAIVVSAARNRILTFPPLTQLTAVSARAITKNIDKPLTRGAARPEHATPPAERHADRPGGRVSWRLCRAETAGREPWAGFAKQQIGCDHLPVYLVGSR